MSCTAHQLSFGKYKYLEICSSFHPRKAMQHESPEASGKQAQAKRKRFTVVANGNPQPTLSLSERSR